MKYFVQIYPESFPGAFTTQIMVNGVQTVCLAIPLGSSSCYHTNAWGRLTMHACAYERLWDTAGVTHTIKPSFQNREDYEKWKQIKKNDVGILSPAKPMDPNRDETNDGTPIFCTGNICLDEIPSESIYLNPRNGKRYVRLVFRIAAKKTRNEDTHELYINPRYGAGCGTKESPANGADAPLRMIGYFKEIPDQTEQYGRAMSLDDKSQPKERKPLLDSEPEKPKTVGGYEF